MADFDDEDPFGEPTTPATVATVSAEEEGGFIASDDLDNNAGGFQYGDDAEDLDVAATTTTTADASGSTSVQNLSLEDNDFSETEHNVVDVEEEVISKKDSTAATFTLETESDTMNEVNLKSSGTTYDVQVTNPEKHGEGITAYTAYTVIVKNFKGKPELKVTRRFNHFQHLHDDLSNKHSGVIIPPLPEKQTMGRFGTDFIETRRVALEKFLKRVLAHEKLSKLQEVADFLELESYDTVLQKKKEKKSIFGSITSSVTETISSAQLTFSKIPETDPWFENRRSQLESLDLQLKGLSKCVETLIKHRKELGTAGGEFGESVIALGNTEFNKPLSSAFAHFGELQEKLKLVHLYQANSDTLNFESTIDEYVRMIGSIKVVLNNRAKIYHTWQASEQTLTKKKEALDKARMDPKKSGKISQMETEVEDVEHITVKHKKEFDDISRSIRTELEKFDEQKLNDFQVALQKFVQQMIESQKKIISMWESYLPEIQAL